jgi:hypothetical protein
MSEDKTYPKKTKAEYEAGIAKYVGQDMQIGHLIGTVRTISHNAANMVTTMCVKVLRPYGNGFNIEYFNIIFRNFKNFWGNKLQDIKSGYRVEIKYNQETQKPTAEGKAISLQVAYFLNVIESTSNAEKKRQKKTEEKIAAIMEKRAKKVYGFEE